MQQAAALAFEAQVPKQGVREKICKAKEHWAAKHFIAKGVEIQMTNEKIELEENQRNKRRRARK